jgi:hypothetical protein
MGVAHGRGTLADDYSLAPRAVITGGAASALAERNSCNKNGQADEQQNQQSREAL